MPGCGVTGPACRVRCGGRQRRGALLRSEAGAGPLVRRRCPGKGSAMFVQVITGRATDVDALRAALDRWVVELAPEAPGWLGSTAGVAADGRAVCLARFSSAEA